MPSHGRLTRAATLALEAVAACLMGDSAKKAFYAKVARRAGRDLWLAYKIFTESLKRWRLVEEVARASGKDAVDEECVLAALAAVGILNKEEVEAELGGRRLVRLAEAKAEELARSPDLAARFSIPSWLAARLRGLLGEEACRLLEAMERLPTWIRVNTLKLDVDKAIRLLEREGFEVEEDEHFPVLLRLRSGSPRRLSLSPLVRRGALLIQDKASVAAVYALEPEPGEVVLDLCAAPGMKTTLIAQLMEGRGRIVAVDVSPRRLETLRRFVRLTGAANVEIMLADSRRLALRARADKALVDAPCSSTGALSADPALKLKLEGVEPGVYAGRQRALLRNALVLAEEVVYSVCSLMPEEGEEIIDRMLEAGARLEPAGRFGLAGYPGYRCSSMVRRTFPHVHECRGFFIARLRAP